ncbi:DNA recombination protein RmuC [Wocania ichthyoenteri]|uniref:DNA recombination protein RmuC n=1 Tax=Wocania ichthyoenteri TaxID=1230531 RepID=UPI00053DE879|nr:DNA recombination protein RmuC [Wocania ichthyoenteri]
MTTEIILLLILIILLAVNLIVTLFKKIKLDFDIEGNFNETKNSLIKFDSSLERTDKSMKDEFQRNREESSSLSKNQREELSKSLDGFKEGFETNTKRLNDLLKDRFDAFSKQQTEINQESEKRIKEVKETVENQLKEIREDNAKQLNEVRKTVDEKLQKTLNERLTQSFETVGKQLKSVQEGLGEMKNLATDVGGLKKVLSNVKMRGGIGEVQLAMLLEQILAPDQYEANVKTKKGSSATVEFAIKLPGKNEDESVVWLPVDAKFPKDVYEKLQEAYEDGDLDKIQFAQKELDNTIKKMAKDISEKYIDPPNTTDFGIMFLPFEGIYAEVVRKASLLETLQRDFKIIVTGPTTLAAILNSLQMGFKTLAIQKRSSEVWHVLGAVKKEFENFGGMMSKAQNNIRTGLNQLDDVMGVRTRAIQRKLKDVTSLDEIDTTKVFPELKDGVIDLDDED